MQEMLKRAVGERDPFPSLSSSLFYWLFIYFYLFYWSLVCPQGRMSDSYPLEMVCPTSHRVEWEEHAAVASLPYSVLWKYNYVWDMQSPGEYA